MSELTTESPSPARHLAPVSSVACAQCGTPVDPLRACQVAFIRERFRYFCTTACRESYNPEALRTPLPAPRSREAARLDGSTSTERIATPTPTSGPRAHSEAAARAFAQVADPPLLAPDAGRGLSPGPAAVSAAADVPVAPSPADDVGPAGVSGLLLAMAVLGSMLAMGLLLAGDSRVAMTSRVVLSAVACMALVAESWLGPRDASELHPAAELAAPVASVVATIIALASSDARTNEAVFLASVIVTSTAASLW
ncbi:MAG TPA: hypothetical protein VGP93_14235, partial [Polyangiaceae bacterium]|nr:hypothetical protein [Polyangiaceae bacterium]